MTTIQVFAQFQPPSSESWEWVHCLTFPTDILTTLQFSLKPFKWIRYATGVVVGAQGHLSFSRDATQHMDYDLDLPSQSIDLFYHTSDVERQKMFPIEPDMGRTHITSSIATTRRDDFRSDIVERDGACVLTGYEESACDAVHLLPHSKGDEYIRTYTQHRSRDAGNDIVNDINDTRNGVLLNKIAHRFLGVDVAFLVTPNFAMDTTDIDPTASPTEKRCSAHLFVPNKQFYFGDRYLPVGSPVRMSRDKWPPDILFDAVYAQAVQLHFPSKSLRETLSGWKPTFYPNGTRNAAQADHQAIVERWAAPDERRDEQGRARQERASERKKRAVDDRDGWFDLMILPYILWRPDEVRAFWREAEEKKAKEEQSQLADKVMSWAEGVAYASPPVKTGYDRVGCHKLSHVAQAQQELQGEQDGKLE